MGVLKIFKLEAFQEFMHSLNCPPNLNSGSAGIPINQVCDFLTTEPGSSPNWVKNAKLALQLFWEMYNDDGHLGKEAPKMARSVLMLVTHEFCGMELMQHGIQLLSEMFKYPDVVTQMVEDDALEATMQVLGRKILVVGDYMVQSNVVHVLLRFASQENVGEWARIWFPSMQLQRLFLAIGDGTVEWGVRHFLNQVNRVEGKVFSVVAEAVVLGHLMLTRPFQTPFWVDFNFGSQRVTIQCNDLDEEEATPSSLWELVSVRRADVLSWQQRQEGSKTVLSFRLSCPSQHLVPTENSLLQSASLSITFPHTLHLEEPLQRIFQVVPPAEKGLRGSFPNSGCVSLEEQSADVSPIPKEKVKKRRLYNPEAAPICTKAYETRAKSTSSPPAKNAILCKMTHDMESRSGKKRTRSIFSMENSFTASSIHLFESPKKTYSKKNAGRKKQTTRGVRRESQLDPKKKDLPREDGSHLRPYLQGASLQLDRSLILRLVKCYDRAEWILRKRFAKLLSQQDPRDETLSELCRQFFLRNQVDTQRFLVAKDRIFSRFMQKLESYYEQAGQALETRDYKRLVTMFRSFPM